VHQNAIRRYCWDELERQNAPRRSLGQPELTMRQWLSDLVRRQLGYYKEWKARCAAAEEQDAERKAQVEAACAATRVQFAVADLETTGLKPESAEVLELAAVIVEPDGTVVSEFEMLVRPESGVPDEIAKLTGITEELARSEGKALEEALSAFLSHVGERPLFFHNAPFDAGFLKVAAKRTRKAFKNPVHDTLPIARQAWPGLRTFRLSALAEHVGAPRPQHRALADARATLAVLLAARHAASG
jgi:DNA polymerase III epsilon subunit family exonuclease